MPNNNLKLIIKVYNISIDRIAQFSNISMEVVQHIYDGEHTPTLNEKDKIATALYCITNGNVDKKEVFPNESKLVDTRKFSKNKNRTRGTGAKKKI